MCVCVRACVCSVCVVCACIRVCMLRSLVMGPLWVTSTVPWGNCLHKAQVHEWCTGIPVMAHWAAIAVFCMTAVGFACVCVCGVSVHMCMHVVGVC